MSGRFFMFACCVELGSGLRRDDVLANVAEFAIVDFHAKNTNVIPAQAGIQCQQT